MTHGTDSLDRDSLVRQIEETFQQLTWLGRRHFARQVDAFGLTAPQYFVLVVIGRRGPAVTMGEIADLLQLPASSLTSMTDRLVKLNLVERVLLPNDRRVVAATITAEGQKLVERVDAISHDELVAMLRDVDEADLRQFGNVLSHMFHEFERSIADHSPWESSHRSAT